MLSATGVPCQSAVPDRPRDAEDGAVRKTLAIACLAISLPVLIASGIVAEGQNAPAAVRHRLVGME